MTRTIFLLLAVMTTCTVSGQEFFQRSYGGHGSDYGRAVIECSDGGYLVVGSTNSFINESTDIYLLRVDEAGEFMWGQNIGLPDHIEWGVGLEEDFEGNFIFAGYTDATPSDSYDGLIIKTDPSGNVIWQKTYGGDDWDFFENLTLTSDGNILVCGQKTVDGNPEGWLLMTSPDGTILWETLVPGNGKVNLTGVDICPSEKIVFTGYIANTFFNSLIQVSGSLNMNGEVIWASTYSEFGKVESGKCKCGISNTILSVGTLHNSDDLTDIIVSSINSQTGATIWTNVLFQSKSLGNGITQKADGNIYFAGSVFGIGFEDYTATINSFASNGDALPPGNTAVLGGFGVDILYDIKTTSDNGLIATGETSSFGNNYQVHLCKISADGTFDIIDIDYLDTSTRIPFLKTPTQFNIYPNPATSEIHVDFEIIGQTVFEILDLTGKILKTGIMNSSRESIDISQLNPGMYFIQIEKADRRRLISRFAKID